MNNISISKKVQNVIDILFVIVVFFLTRQVPFSFLNSIMNICVLAICFLTFLIRGKEIMNNKYSFFFLLIFPICASLFYTLLFTNNDLSNVFRSFILLLVLGTAYFVKIGRKAFKAFIILCLLQICVLILLHAWILVYFDINSYLPVRVFFQSMNWGDVYTYNGFYYRIQIPGNALLVVALMMHNEWNLFKKKYLINIFLLTGIILAGNFAYLISVLLYAIYKFFSLKNYKNINRFLVSLVIILFFIVSLSPVIFNYVNEVLSMKQGDSLAARDDQFFLLLQDMHENYFTQILGKGLGNTIDVVTAFRDYTGDVYYELQSVYIYNQLGILFFGLFVIYNLWIAHRVWGQQYAEMMVLYSIYIIYASTNPYIFDTNHFVVIILLGALAEKNRVLSCRRVEEGLLLKNI